MALPGMEGEGPSWLSFSARRPDHPLQELVNWDDAAFLTLDGTRYERVRLPRPRLPSHPARSLLEVRPRDHADFIRFTAIETYALQRRGRGLQIPEAADEGEGKRIIEATLALKSPAAKRNGLPSEEVTRVAQANAAEPITKYPRGEGLRCSPAVSRFSRIGSK